MVRRNENVSEKSNGLELYKIVNRTKYAVKSLLSSYNDKGYIR